MLHQIVGEGDMNALAMKVRPTVTLNDIAVLTVGAHILMIHIDAESGRLRGIEGFEVTEDWITEALDMHSDQNRDDQFSSVIIEVDPLTDEEGGQIADTIIAKHIVERPLNDRQQEAHDQLRIMLIEAARAGRGLDG